MIGPGDIFDIEAIFGTEPDEGIWDFFIEFFENVGERPADSCSGDGVVVVRLCWEGY